MFRAIRARAPVPGTRVAAGYLVLANQGESRMWPVARLELQPGAVVRFSPSGLHVMIEGSRAPFKAGDKVPLKPQFDGGEPEITVLLEVRAPTDPAPAPAQPDPH